MSETETGVHTTESAAEVLARSAFGFGLLATLPALIAFGAVLFAPHSPNEAFARLQPIVTAVFGLVVVALLAYLVYLYHAPMEKHLVITRLLERVFGVPVVAVVVFVLVLKVNFGAGVAFINVAPYQVEPARFLYGAWTVVFALILGVIQWRNLQGFWARTQTLWASIGLGLVLLVGASALYIVTSGWVNSMGINNVLRGGLDYRPLSFVDDGEQPTSPESFWLEQAQVQVRWSPYTYWMSTASSGRYVNVSEDGLRATPQRMTMDEAGGRIFVFGGSTIWGEGARDAYTIPSHLARRLQASNLPYYVVNYGQTGYVSTQDMLLFQLQLLRDNVPEVAIFYGGFNDTLAAYGEGLVGVTLQESQRLSDSEAGRRLRTGQFLLSPLNLSLTLYHHEQAGARVTSAEAIAERWLANVRMIGRIADGYGVRVFFVWQPHIMGKAIYTPEEEAILGRMATERAGFSALYGEVDDILRQRVADEGLENILILSDLFADDERTIFHDLVHITEVGNDIVAEAILYEIEQALP